MTGEQVVKALGRGGFKIVSTRGRHCKVRHVERGLTAIVPLHRELAARTVRSILRQADLDVPDLRDLLR